MSTNGGIFITGTDTGVGKTIVSAALTMALRTAGIDAVPMKPVQTGCLRRHGAWVAPDLEFALQAVGLAPTAQERRWMAPYLFKPAVSPHLAARLARKAISLPRLHRSYAALQRRHEFVVVEGAGGVLVPLGGGWCMLDLMARLALPVILVARPGLGTLNHTMLSLRELQRAGLQVAGVVFNAAQPGRPGLIEKDNRQTVESLTEIPVIATLPYYAGLGQGADGQRQLHVIADRLSPLANALASCRRSR